MENKELHKIEIYKPSDCISDMLNEYKKGKVRGTTTYNPLIDKAWTWRRQEFNITSGYSNEGKSLFLKQLCLIKALEEKKKFIFCSPEDFPASEFYDDMIHTLAGVSTDRARSEFISEKLYQKAYDLIKDLFYFIYLPPPGNTIKGVLTGFEDIIKSDPDVLGCIIDPILKFARPKDMPDRDDIYGSYIGAICVDFARRTNTSLHLVMHQLTPKLTEEKLYPKPNMYSVKGGGSYADGVDNLLYVWRPNYAKDKEDTSVIFGSQKIKKQKLVGIPQDIPMTFNRKTNRYMIGGESVFNFDKFIYNEKK